MYLLTIHMYIFPFSFLPVGDGHDNGCSGGHITALAHRPLRHRLPHLGLPLSHAARDSGMSFLNIFRCNTSL